MRTVVVTGGSRGIGKAVVEKFAASGDNVVFFYNNSVETAKELESCTGAVAIKADVRDAEQVRSSFSDIVSKYGTVDVLVTSAGIAKIAQIKDITDEDFRNIVDTDLSGTFYALRDVSDIMVKNKSGRIITVGSVWGNYGASCETAYSAAKAGVRGLTKALAKELAPSGITVNCVEPGVIDTDMNRSFSESDRREIIDSIPAGRIGTPEEVAELIFFLASDSAAYITGQCIGIDGGFC